MTNDFLRRAYPIFSNRLGRVTLSLIITPVLVRLLGSAAYGEYAFILALLGIITVIINSGIFDGVRKFIPEDREEYPEWKNQVFGYYVRFGFILAGAAMVLLLLFIQFDITSKYIKNSIGPSLFLLAFLIPLRQIFRIVRGTFLAMGLEYIGEPIEILRKLIFIIFGIPLIYFGYSVRGAVVGHIVANLIALSILLVLLHDKIDYGSIFRRVPEGFPTKELLDFNVGSTLFTIFNKTLLLSDVILLFIIIGSQSTGYYRAALAITEVIWMVPTTLEILLLQFTSKYWSKGQHKEISRIASKVTRLSLIITLIMVIGLFFLADAFIPIYFGDEFYKSVTPLLLLLPGTLAFALAKPIYSISQAEGKIRPLILASGGASMVNLAANLLLIPPFGMQGAAIGTTIGYTSMLLFHIISAQVIGFNPLADIRILAILTSASAAAITIFLLTRLIQSNTVSIIVIPPIGFLAYMIYCLISGAISVREVKMMVKTLHPIPTTN